jgi:hypothetical protein
VTNPTGRALPTSAPPSRTTAAPGAKPPALSHNPAARTLRSGSVMPPAAPPAVPRGVPSVGAGKRTASVAFPPPAPRAPPSGLKPFGPPPPSSTTPGGTAAALAAPHVFQAPAPLAPTRAKAPAPPYAPRPAARSGSMMPRPAQHHDARSFSSAVPSKRSASIAFPKPFAPKRGPQEFNPRSSLGGESLADLMSGPGGDRSRSRAPIPQLSEAEGLEMQLLQWRFLNWRFTHTKGEQLQAGLDRLSHSLAAAEDAHDREATAEAERRERDVRRAVARVVGDVALGPDLPALERFGELHEAFVESALNASNALPTVGVSVSSEAALQAEVQRCGHSLQTVVDTLRPAGAAASDLLAAWQRLEALQRDVAADMAAIAVALRTADKEHDREASVLIGRIQEAGGDPLDADEIPAAT